MTPEQKTRYEAQAHVIKAIAHPTRLFILEELKKSECCVSDLKEMIGVDVSTVSKHLSVLKNAGLVRDEKRGTSIFYFLRVPCILDFTHCVQKVLEANAQEHVHVINCCN